VWDDGAEGTGRGLLRGRAQRGEESGEDEEFRESEQDAGGELAWGRRKSGLAWNEDGRPRSERASLRLCSSDCIGGMGEDGTAVRPRETLRK
jgi:hypothetical protein